MHEPAKDFIGGTQGLLALAEEAYQLAKDKPGEKLPILTCFLLVNSLRDWATAERLVIDASVSPFRQTVREVANGTKHLTLDKKAHPKPHVGKIRPARPYGQGTYGQGLYGGPICLMGQRTTSDPIELVAASTVLRESLDWWATAIA